MDRLYHVEQQRRRSLQWTDRPPAERGWVRARWRGGGECGGGTPPQAGRHLRLGWRLRHLLVGEPQGADGGGHLRANARQAAAIRLRQCSFASGHRVASRGGPGGSVRAHIINHVYGKPATLGVRRTFGVVAPPVLSMTLEISPLGPMQTVIKSWNLTLGLWGASKARVSTTPLFRKTL